MNLGKFLDAARKINEIARINRYSLISSYWKFFQLATREQYSPVEIFMEDLLNPFWSNEEQAGMISKESFLRIQEAINPQAYWHLTEDKIAFHHYCVKNSLPVPEMVAVYDPEGKSCWGDGTPIDTREQFLEGLKNYQYDLIAKPVHGVHGIGVICLDFVNGHHVSVDDPDLTLNKVMNSAVALKGDQYIFQKRLYSHQKIAEFTNNPILQGLRLITCLDENDHPHLIIRKIKLSKKGNIVDNFSWGANQGRQCIVDENGFIKSTATYHPEKKHVVRQDYVEDATGNRAGFKVPMWEQCVALVLEAQRVFAPLRTIGWDVAVTDDGPFLIEGNVFWDPLMPQEGNMREVCRLLTEQNQFSGN